MFNREKYAVLSEKEINKRIETLTKKLNISVCNEEKQQLSDEIFLLNDILKERRTAMKKRVVPIRDAKTVADRTVRKGINRTFTDSHVIL